LDHLRQAADQIGQNLNDRTYAGLVDSENRETSNGAPRSSSRRTNSRRIVDVLRIKGPLSQAALARAMGLSPATVSGLIRDLRSQGIAELRPLNGRESLVALAEPDTAAVSVEVTSRTTRIALFDFRNRQRHDETVEHTNHHSNGGDPNLVADLVRTVVNKAEMSLNTLAGVAVGIQSPVAPETGTIAAWAHNHLAAWLGIPVKETLSNKIGVPVVVENNANLAALAEWTWGVGRGSPDFLYLMCAAGVGGGFILDGKIYHGNAGLAGEIGHLVLEPNGPVCFCGSRGCLTTYASERSILLALEVSGSPHHSIREVIDSARAGDPATRAVLWEAGRYLGRAVFSVAKVIAPSVIAVGGVLSEAGPLLFDSLNSSVEINSLRAVASTSRIEPAEIINDGTLLGGLATILETDGRGLSTLPDWTHTPPSTPVPR
jgi:predicted NBD/HSP70 family sugar kinase